MLKGGISGRSARGKRIHTRAIHSIDTDIKLNRALWVMAETLLESMRLCCFPESAVLTHFRPCLRTFFHSFTFYKE